MKFMRLSILLILVFVYCFKTQAQFYENALAIDSPKIQNSGDLNLKLDNATFFRNDEYFGKVVEGYTLPGFWLQPKLNYQLNQKTELTGGIHLLKFFGQKKIYNIEPYLTIKYNITDHLSLIIGSLNTKYGHFLPSPIFDPERFYFNQVENGIQFQFMSTRIMSDTWLSWDQFIYYGDSIQELLTAGSSNKVQLVNTGKIEFNLPIYLLFTHMGGQINRPKKPIETLMNFGTGIELKVNIDRFIKIIQFEPQFLYYNKSTSALTRVFKNGWAFYPTITLFTKNFYLKNSWWRSDSFIGPRGESIYQHVSTDQTFFVKKRNLWIPKIGFFKKYADGFQISAGFEGFYDPSQKLFDYNYYVQFNFSGSWLLKNLSRR